MKITITVSVRDDQFTTLTREITADQEPFFLGNLDKPDRPIAVVRREAIRKTKTALDRLIAQAGP